MRKTMLVLGICLLTFVPASLAQAPSTKTLHINDAAVLPGASVRCFAKQLNTLVCGGSKSKVYIQISRSDVRVFRAVGRSAIFKQIFTTPR